jgi:hypothetical protein
MLKQLATVELPASYLGAAVLGQVHRLKVSKLSQTNAI